MRQFYRFMGGLTFVFLIAAFALEKHGSAGAKAALALAGLVWLATTAVVGVAHAAARVLPAARRSESALSARSSGDLIEGLCHESGWVLTGREVDRYQVRSGDHRSNVYIELRHSDSYRNIVLQSWFPIRFSLEKPPSGLFARVLLRSSSLTWSSWSLNIGPNCDAALVVGASLPVAGMNAALFCNVCEEMAGEIRGFRQELYEKFAYDLGDGRMPMMAPGPARGGLPVRRGTNVPGIWQETERRQVEW
jgi:hypothetical protein